MKRLFFLLMAFCTTMALAQKKNIATATDTRLQGLEAEMEAFLKAGKASSIAVAIVEKNKVIYAKGFGYSDAANKVAATEKSLYAIGSCTKAFTSSLIGLLQQDGKLDIDKPVRSYLPELKFYNDNLNNHITLRDMMCHRTGLPRHDLSWYLFPTTRDSLIQRIQYLQPNADIRMKYQYNNFMFMAQGQVAQKITGMPWEEQIKQKLLTPLGMKGTTFTANSLKGNALLAEPYSLNEDSSLKLLPHYPIEGMGPAGNIYSSASEMALWVQAWINGGKLNGKEILPASYAREAISSQMISSAGLPNSKRPEIHFSNYGFGWDLTSYKGHYRVDHGGNIDGFSTNVSFFPTDSIGIVVLVNQDGSWVPNMVRNTIVDRLLKLPKYDWLGEKVKDMASAKAALDSANKAVAITRKPVKMNHALKDYEGLYNHPGYGTLDVKRKGDSLMAATPKYNIWLEHWHFDIFVPYILSPGDKIDTVNRSGMRVQFNTNVNGDVESLNMIGLEDPSIPLVFKRSPKLLALDSAALTVYVGNYELSGTPIKVYISKGILYVLVPGQPDYELQYVGDNKFKLKVAEGYFLQFGKDANQKIDKATFVQPNGNFTAIRKN